MVDACLVAKVQQYKVQLRRELRAAWSSLGADALRCLGRSAARRLTTLPEWRRARTVFTYVSTADELPTDPVIEAAWRSSKRVAAPVIVGPGEMEAYPLPNWEVLIPGPYGLLAPDPTQVDPLKPEEIDVAIVPGLAFDRAGFRLGKGGGYYDRFLPRLSPGAVAVGWTIERFFVDALPRLDHDVPVGLIVTERCVWRCAG